MAANRVTEIGMFGCGAARSSHGAQPHCLSAREKGLRIEPQFRERPIEPGAAAAVDQSLHQHALLPDKPGDRVRG